MNTKCTQANESNVFFLYNHKTSKENKKIIYSFCYLKLNIPHKNRIHIMEQVVMNLS